MSEPGPLLRANRRLTGKLLLYPVPHRRLFLAEVLLRLIGGVHAPQVGRVVFDGEEAVAQFAVGS